MIRNEDYGQIAQVNMLRGLEARGLLTFFHVPNQLARTKKLQLIFYNLGMQAGVTDLVILLPGGKTIHVENKYNTKPSSAQVTWRQTLVNLGHTHYQVSFKTQKEAQENLLKILLENGVRT